MTSRVYNPKAFVDSLRVYVKGGTGGKGLTRYGGIGGRGGNVTVVCDPKANLKDLSMTKENLRFTAGVGENSKRMRLVGNSGEDVQFPVPPGVFVKIDSGRILGELNEPGDTVIVAKGGAGGSRQNSFMQQKGHALNITLDLKVIADIGLVGFPNAGKSTVLRALSRAAPKVAAYPFTTMQPHVGTMMYPDTRQIMVADLPGLIEGAHINIGLGHKFLKHVERTKLLLFMIDLTGFRLKIESPMRSPFETIVLLMKELELYNPELINKPAVLALNKIDIPGAVQTAEDVIEKVNNIRDHLHEIPKPLWPDVPMKFEDILVISARNRENTEQLKVRLREVLDDLVEREYVQTPQNYDDFETTLAKALTEHQGGKPLV